MRTICIKDECGRPERAKGLCTAHYNNARYARDPERGRRIKQEWVARNKEKVRLMKRSYSMLKQYGLTLEQYDILLQSQDGKCAICKSTNSGRKDIKDFAVDHCHVTKKVRGLLCYNCNVGIGLFKENANVILSAVEYVKKHNAPIRS